MFEDTTLITGGRRSGKTVSLVMQSAKTGYSILTMRKSEYYKRIPDYAEKLGLEIPDPILIEAKDLPNITEIIESYNPKGILVDDIDVFINNLFDGRYHGGSISNDFVKTIYRMGPPQNTTGNYEEDLDKMVKNIKGF